MYKAVILACFLFSLATVAFTEVPEAPVLTNDQQYELLRRPGISTGGDNISLFWAIFLNIVPGFGVGSFLQSNTIAGVIQVFVCGVPFAYGGYRAVDIMSDCSPALYVTWPFIVVFSMLVDIWPLFTYGAGLAYGIVSAVRTHRASDGENTGQARPVFTAVPGGFMVSCRY